jgi:hypothetical protein
VIRLLVVPRNKRLGNPADGFGGRGGRAILLAEKWVAEFTR